MKVPITYVGDDPQLKKLSIQLQELLNGKIDTDNLRGIFLSGTTSDIADTGKLFRHNQNPKPVLAFPVTGDTYVTSIDKDNIDIRSRLTSHEFTVFLLQGKRD